MKNSRAFLSLLLGLILLITNLLLTPCFFITSGDRILGIYPILENSLAFKIRFIHSVQKTPVEEFLTVNREGDFKLLSTRYQSFGVGLPFMESDGSFYKDGDYYIMDNMNRSFENLSLRPGVSTRLTLYVHRDELKLYELMPLGSRVDLFTATLGAWLVK